MHIIDELVKLGKLSELQGRAIKSLGLDMSRDSLQDLLSQYSLTSQDILEARASFYGLSILKDGVRQSAEAIDKLSKVYIDTNKVIPIQTENGSLVIGIVDPEYNNIIDNLKLEMLKQQIPYKAAIIRETDFNLNFKNNYPDAPIQKVDPIAKTSELVNNVENNLNQNNQIDLNINNGPEINTNISNSIDLNKEAQSTEGIKETDVVNRIKEAQEEAIKTTKEEEAVTFAGLVNTALKEDENIITNNVEADKKAREEILSEEDLLDISENDGDLERLRRDGDGSAVDEINTVLKYAIDSEASDVHIEHAGEYTRVRVRIDGELTEIASFGKTMHPMIVARVKILSGMRLDEKRKPQDGRFSVLLNSHKIDFRVSTMPGYYGEKIVMRILDSYRGIRKLEDIGFSVRHLEQIRNALRKPYGMILISGPTGSGKTTTLYSMLNEIDRKSKNVVSLEDPIEYNVPGMNQSQVFPEIGYTFASGLRSILRQDPDVIMVGEIRDGETAQLAVQAALTGHLVFSTIHTNNSVGVLTRLIDMGVDPFLIAPTLNLAIAQRLTRHIVDGAQDPILDNPGVDILVEKQFEDLPDEYKKNLNINRPLNNPKPTADNPTGMRGRVPVLEILEVDKDIQKSIINRDNEEDVWKIARSKGMISMKEDAIMKSMDGLIPFVEINNL